MLKTQTFRKFLYEKEKGLINKLGLQEFKEEKVYFVDEIVAFVEEYLSSKPIKKWSDGQNQMEDDG